MEHPKLSRTVGKIHEARHAQDVRETLSPGRGLNPDGFRLAKLGLVLAAVLPQAHGC